jgi:leader peptidase (prepilin peptidase)/N-methyltransferase
MSGDVGRLIALGVGGLLFGSFATVLVTRLPERRGVAAGRSACPGCGTLIRAVDNIPVVSFLVLRGRCRACHARISLFYPAIEVAMAALFVAVGIAVRDAWLDVLLAPFVGVLLAAAVIDARHRIIPNRLVYASLATFGTYLVVARAAHGAPSPVDAGLGFLAYGGCLFIVALVVPGGMGMGDVKLAALIGMVLGSLGLRYVAVAGMAAVLTGGIGALVAMAAGRGRRQTMPFGPFLAAGATVASLFGAPVAAWYVGFLR